MLCSADVSVQEQGAVALCWIPLLSQLLANAAGTMGVANATGTTAQTICLLPWTAVPWYHVGHWAGTLGDSHQPNLVHMCSKLLVLAEERS